MYSYEVKKMTKHYSDNKLAKELGFKPNEHDCAFYPDTIDTKNHVYKAKRALSGESQIEWAANDTKNNFFPSIYRGQ